MDCDFLLLREHLEDIAKQLTNPSNSIYVTDIGGTLQGIGGHPRYARVEDESLVVVIMTYDTPVGRLLRSIPEMHFSLSGTVQADPRLGTERVHIKAIVASLGAPH